MRLSKKVLTEKEAHDKIQHSFQKVSTLSGCIIYWRQRIGIPFQHLDKMDRLILDSDNLKSAEEYIAKAEQERSYIMERIYKDYGRFTKVKNNLG